MVWYTLRCGVYIDDSDNLQVKIRQDVGRSARGDMYVCGDPIELPNTHLYTERNVRLDRWLKTRRRQMISGSMEIGSTSGSAEDMAAATIPAVPGQAELEAYLSVPVTDVAAWTRAECPACNGKRR